MIGHNEPYSGIGFWIGSGHLRACKADATLVAVFKTAHLRLKKAEFPAHHTTDFIKHEFSPYAARRNTDKLVPVLNNQILPLRFAGSNPHPVCNQHHEQKPHATAFHDVPHTCHVAAQDAQESGKTYIGQSNLKNGKISFNFA